MLVPKLKPGQSPAELLQELTKGGGARRHKFSAVRTGSYASKREARFAQQLLVRRDAGEILDWLEQVPVRLPGGIRYVIDFAIIERDGTVSFVEIKGFETQVWKNKQLQLRELRPEIFARLTVVR